MSFRTGVFAHITQKLRTLNCPTVRSPTLLLRGAARAIRDVVPRMPVYHEGMEAKKIHYRQRLKLRKALARVTEILAENLSKGIPIEADWRSARMAQQVVTQLVRFIHLAGVRDDPGTDDLYLRWVRHLETSRRRETEARKRRRKG